MNALFGNDIKQGSFLRSFIHINAKDLKFTEQTDGKYQTTFDVLAITFGDNGVPVDQFSKNFVLTINKESFENLIANGFVYNFIFPIKKPGAYQMRVVLRDALTAKLGSANQFIEVPNLKKNRLTLSSIMLSNHTNDEWQNQSKTSSEKVLVDSLTATSLRKFQQNTVLRYGFEIFNAKLATAQRFPNLQLQVRIFRDGKLIFDGEPKNIDFDKQTDFTKTVSGGALALGKTMEKGDYVLQIVLIDKLAKIKNQVASQWISFEII